MTTPDKEESHGTPEMKRAAMTDARNVCELADTLREIEKQCIQADDPEHHTLSLVKYLARHALARLPQPASEAGKLSSAAANDVLAERERQQSGEGWGTDHDDAHDRGEMALAAACYALHSTERGREAHYIHGQWQDNVDLFWDWDRMWWKPKGARRNLVRAAALLIAEIERLDRAEAKLSTGEVAK